ncbi:hypothetical protein M1N05_01855 [Dehalococcoidales bacterium]|nr:hypothetical protein [Dehalococcoidales bacterium]
MLLIDRVRQKVVSQEIGMLSGEKRGIMLRQTPLLSRDMLVTMMVVICLI